MVVWGKNRQGGAALWAAEARPPHSGAALLCRTSVLSQRLKTLAEAIVKQNSRPFWAAPQVRRKFGAQRRIAQGEFISPEQFNHRRVEPPSGRRNPKKKDTTYVVSFFFGGAEQSLNEHSASLFSTALTADSIGIWIVFLLPEKLNTSRRSSS